MSGPGVSHQLADLIRRNRLLWGGVCWVVALLMTGFGFAYLIGGASVTSTPKAFAVLTLYVPGGLHTYGGVFAAAGLALLHGLLTAAHPGQQMLDGYLHHVLPLAASVGVGVIGMFAASWWITGTPTWPGIGYWTAITALCVLLRRLPPYPPATSRDQ